MCPTRFRVGGRPALPDCRQGRRGRGLARSFDLVRLWRKPPRPYGHKPLKLARPATFLMMVGIERFELSRGCPHKPLKLACLPVPPYPPEGVKSNEKWRGKSTRLAGRRADSPATLCLAGQAPLRLKVQAALELLRDFFLLEFLLISFSQEI